MKALLETLLAAGVIFVTVKFWMGLWEPDWWFVGLLLSLLALQMILHSLEAWFDWIEG